MKKQNRNILAYARPNNNTNQYTAYTVSCNNSNNNNHNNINSNHQLLSKSVSAVKNMPIGYKYKNRKQCQTQLGNSGIYNQIVENMQPDYYQYLNKLIDKTNKQQRKANKPVRNTTDLNKMQERIGNKQQNNWDSIQHQPKQMDVYAHNYVIHPKQHTYNDRQKQRNSVKMLNCHQRTKSYADIVVDTPKTSKQHGKIIKNQQNKQSKISQMFYSGQTTPKAQKSSSEMRQSYKNSRKAPQNKQFLSCLDNYIHDLSLQQTRQDFLSNTGVKKLVQRRTISKQQPNKNILKNTTNKSHYNISSNSNCSVATVQANSNIVQRLEQTCKQVKSLKMKNQIFESENIELKRKNKRIKGKMTDMLEHLHYLTNQIQQQRFQRKKMDQFFQDIQGKIMAMRPQRKTIGRMQTIEGYYHSQSTEQDQQRSATSSTGIQFDIMNFNAFMKSKPTRSHMSRKSVSRQQLRAVYSTSKNNSTSNNKNSNNNSNNNSIIKKRKYHQNLSKQQISKVLAQKYDNQIYQISVQDSDDDDDSGIDDDSM